MLFRSLVEKIIGDIPVRLNVDYLKEREVFRLEGHLDHLADVVADAAGSAAIRSADVSTSDPVGSGSAAIPSAASSASDPVGSGSVPAGLGIAKKVVFTGPIDQFFDYCLGDLQYRSVRFETEVLDTPKYQGNAVINYTDAETPYTRIIEHKHFEFGKDEDGNELPKTVISREYSAEWNPGDEPYYPVNNDATAALFAAYQELAAKEKDVIFGGRLGEYKYYDMDQVIAKALQDVREEFAENEGSRRRIQ